MVSTRRHVQVLAGILLAGCLSRPLAAADWPQWRGPGRNGVVEETSGYPAGWPPVKLWQRGVGKGCSSPILVAGRLYVMGWHGRGSRGTDTLLCLDAASGNELWKQSYASRYQGRLRTGDEGAYGGPSATPTFDPQTGLLYTLGIDGDLRCWNTRASGRLVWAMNFHETYRIRQRKSVGGGRRDYGHTSSPLIHGDLLIVEVGSEEGTVMAFEKRTGRRRWSSALKGPAGHTAGPVPMKVQGVDCIANLLISALVVMRIDRGHEGRSIATYPRKTEFACNIPTPAVAGGRVVLTSEYNQSNTEMIEVTLTGARKAWRSRTHALVATPLVHRGRVYLVDGPAQCLDLATGRRQWRGGSFGHGSCIMTADEKLLAFGKGKLVLVDAPATAGTYRELSRAEGIVRGTCYPHLALANGLICCKDRTGQTVVLSVRPTDRQAVAKVHKPAPAGRDKPTPAGPARPTIETHKLHDAPAPKMANAWPGNRDGLVFLWDSPRSRHRVRPRGAAKFTPPGAMDLAGGAMLAEGADEPLLAACRKSNQLAIEARITPADLRQSGPARIVSFSTDGYHRNFTLAQEKDRLVLRLRTPRTGDNGMRPETTVCRLRAGKTHHVIVSYSPGRLTAYLDGNRVLDTAAVRGDFSNWSAQHLLFGDEYSDRRDWAGRLEGIAIHSRVIGAKEATQRHRQAVKKP